MDNAMYVVVWLLDPCACNPQETHTGFTCRHAAVRFALAKSGALYTREEYREYMNNTLAKEVC